MFIPSRDAVVFWSDARSKGFLRAQTPKKEEASKRAPSQEKKVVEKK
jgi:hypothetical protein